MRRSKEGKEVQHSKIVTVAARRFRERGLQGIGIADVMKEAGTSVGGFYKHFESRDELVVEALAEAFKMLESLEQDASDLGSYLDEVTSNKHRDYPGTGCAISAFAGEMRHASTGVRTVYTQQVKHTLRYYTEHLKGNEDQARRARAILLLSAVVGGISLARSVNDKALSNEILSSLREEFKTLASRRLPPKRDAKC